MTTRELQAAANVSARQLQYWAENGFLPVKVVGHKRLYHPSDVRKAKALNALAKAGLQVRFTSDLIKGLDQFDRAVRIDRPMIIDRVLYVPTWSVRKNLSVKGLKRREFYQEKSA